MCEGVTDRVVQKFVFLKKKNKDNGVTRPQPCLGRSVGRARSRRTSFQTRSSESPSSSLTDLGAVSYGWMCIIWASLVCALCDMQSGGLCTHDYIKSAAAVEFCR